MIVLRRSTLAALGLAMLLAPAAAQTARSRDEVLAFFQQHAAPASATNAFAAVPPPSAETLGPMLAALESLASKKADEDLVRALFLYQVTNPGAQEPRPALTMGRLYWAQPKSFRAVLRSLEGRQQRILMPYIEFGWKECIRPKNKSDRWLRDLQQELDRISAGMINAR